MHWRKSDACFTSLSHVLATSFISLTRKCVSPEGTETCSSGPRVFCKKFQTILSKTDRCEGDSCPQISQILTDRKKRGQKSARICVICGRDESFAGKKDRRRACADICAARRR